MTKQLQQLLNNIVSLINEADFVVFHRPTVALPQIFVQRNLADRHPVKLVHAEPERAEHSFDLMIFSLIDRGKYKIRVFL